MNYYEHHLGDYMRDTAHLSLLEEGVYRRMIDAYYVKEAPLPNDQREICRLVRAQSKIERETVEIILKEFFCQNLDGWHHKRCDKELNKYKSKREAAKRSADIRWGKDANAQNNDANALRTQSDGNAHQSPVTSHQSNKDISHNNGSDIDATDLKNKPNLKSVTVQELRKLGVTTKMASPIFLAWVKDGFTAQHIMACITKARKHKPEPETIPEKYLDKIIREPLPWYTNDQTIRAEQSRLDLPDIRGETTEQLKARITAERKRRKS